MPIPSQILNTQDVGDMLGFSPRTVEDYARAGRFPSTKFSVGWTCMHNLIIKSIQKLTIKDGRGQAHGVRVVC